MIEQLHVKDYILFKDTTIDFSSGMTSITGETGAGKSLLIDAISYLSGARIQSNIVRKGQEKAILQMVLRTENEQVHSFLEENGFEVDEVIVITRIVNAKQKSTIRLNQQITTLGFVRQLISMLVDVHSQMDTYQLMDTKVQLDVLDQYAKTMMLRSEVATAYQVYAKLSQEYNTLTTETLSDDELDYVTQQYNTIEQADIKENELEELQERIRTCEQAHSQLESLSKAIYQIGGENRISDQLYELSRTLDNNEEISDMYYRIEDIRETLVDQMAAIQKDADDLDQLQAREYELRSLYKKYGGSYASTLEKKEILLAQIDRIIHRDDVLQKLKASLDEAEVLYKEKATQLSQKRQACCNTLCQLVQEHCKDVMLEHARFQIVFSPKTYSSDGMDHVEFQIAMNPGQPFASLKESASGGELSRLMLALKVVFQSQRGIETILFDEIDTGVSGKVALAMGKKMHTLSKDYQVLCITHLASVAAWSDTHYCVSKESDGDTTTTSVRCLNEQETLEELAVMSTGSVNEASLEAAKELKERILHG